MDTDERTIKELIAGRSDETLGLFTGIEEGNFKCLLVDKTQTFRIKVDKLVSEEAYQEDVAVRHAKKNQPRHVSALTPLRQAAGASAGT